LAEDCVILTGAVSGKSVKFAVAMPFHFKKSESPARAVRRVCRERIRFARERLRQCERPGAVHGARKEIKKLRAVLRLVRGEIGPGNYRKVAKALRQAADCLAVPRDALVMFKAFRKLAGRDIGRFAGIEKALHKNWRRATRRFQDDGSVAAASRILRKTNRRIGDLKIKPNGWAAIEPGLRQSYRCCQEFCRLVRGQPSPENFHEWRKHVKDLWHDFCLLSPAWPAETRAMADELELLGKHLGDDHDLVLLQQFVTEHCAGRAGEAVALNLLIESRRNELRAAALKLGSRLFAETPAVICRRLGKDWNDWRAK
jgi:CHAD domain-containing protein